MKKISWFAAIQRQIPIPAMYRTSTSCPTAVRSARRKLMVRTGVIFLNKRLIVEPSMGVPVVVQKTRSYAHGFDADRKLIAQEMDSGFFAKVGQKQEPKIDAATLEQIKNILLQHPELLREIEQSGNG